MVVTYEPTCSTMPRACRTATRMMAYLLQVSCVVRIRGA
jgi:hypothetical protein